MKTTKQKKTSKLDFITIICYLRTTNIFWQMKKRVIKRVKLNDQKVFIYYTIVFFFTQLSSQANDRT